MSRLWKSSFVLSWLVLDDVDVVEEDMPFELGAAVPVSVLIATSASSVVVLGTGGDSPSLQTDSAVRPYSYLLNSLSQTRLIVQFSQTIHLDCMSSILSWGTPCEVMAASLEGSWLHWVSGSSSRTV